ncbi:MAG: hypothetical protein FWF78_08015 [Defluviitaleaceae bacterium]|nr:hypothetical protein [Defluviitaleaceae bacterium]
MNKLKVVPNKLDDKIRVQIYHVKENKAKEMTAIIDTGAYNSYLGDNALKRIGYEINIDKVNKHKDRLIPMQGITGENHIYPRKCPDISEKIYASLPIKLSNLYFSTTIVVDSPTIHLPVSFHVQKNDVFVDISFEQRDIVLIGMDILRDFNFGVDIEQLPFFSISRPASLVTPRNKPIMQIKFI